LGTVTLTLEEYDALRRLISSERESEGAKLALKKKSRKRRKDPKMKKALQEANKKLRNKNGSIKKGKSQSDIMKLAHRLRRKMK
tara:strand:+ start:232 stop:483 length:252 start_codon:yes stop_codon:yes gene_type:complete